MGRPGRATGVHRHFFPAGTRGTISLHLRPVKLLKPNKATDRFEFERPLWRIGLHRVAGVDEAGRGPLAGPVMAAAVVLPPAWAIDGLPPSLGGADHCRF